MIKHCLYFLICFLVTIKGFCAISPEERKEEMLQDLNNIQNIFYTSYAPALVKKDVYEWELNFEVEKAKNKVLALENPKDKDFHKIVRELMESFHDYHVNAFFASTESATLPFSVKSAGGKYFFVYVDNSELTGSEFPFESGDEITHFDGRPINEVIAELAYREKPSQNYLTDLAFAEFFLTRRSGRLGFEVPKGEIVITGKKSFSGNTISSTLSWNYKPERVTDRYCKLIKFDPYKKKSEEELLKNVLNVEFVASHYRLTKDVFVKNSSDPTSLGDKNGFLPDLGNIRWRNSESEPFRAYIYEKNGYLIGYLRISDYSVESVDLDELESTISFLNQYTSALVIDQANNPGGLYLSALKMLSFLIEKPIPLLKQKVIISQVTVSGFLEFLDFFQDLDEDLKKEYSQFYSVDVDKLISGAHFIVNEWNEGRVLTEPGYLLGFDKVIPANKVYTKPILVLVNSLSISCGDIFPAVLQDNKRAVILGETTAGAGGTVESTSFPNLSGIQSVNVTSSVIMRENGDFLEGLGVKPDIEYSLTELDLTNNYCEYVEKVNCTVEQLIEDNKREGVQEPTVEQLIEDNKQEDAAIPAEAPREGSEEEPLVHSTPESAKSLRLSDEVSPEEKASAGIAEEDVKPWWWNWWGYF